MDIYSFTDHAILKQIGRRLQETRVSENISQRELSDECGLSVFSISQMENGHNTSLLSLVMVLRALRRLDILEELFEERPLSPVALSEYMKKNVPRQRAGGTKPAKASALDRENFDWEND